MSKVIFLFWWLLTLRCCISSPLRVVSVFHDYAVSGGNEISPLIGGSLGSGIDDVTEGLSEDFEDRINVRSRMNYRPIIGVLSQELPSELEKALNGKNYSSYIAASYVKFVESAGARVVPVLINQTDEYYEHLGRSLNGFLLPGGSQFFDSEFTKAAKKLYNMATRGLKPGKKLALWATCLGFENLLYFAAGKNPLTKCKANNREDPLTFEPGYESSRLFRKISKKVLKALASKNVTANFHHNCVLPQTFYEMGINETLKILSTTKDEDGLKYVSTVEHRFLPIFGTQWHPEKAAFEWAATPRHNHIPHSIEAVQASQSLAEIFVQNARRNLNHFASVEEENSYLIYNYAPVYIGKFHTFPFELCYFFH